VIRGIARRAILNAEGSGRLRVIPDGLLFLGVRVAPYLVVGGFLLVLAGAIHLPFGYVGGIACLTLAFVLSNEAARRAGTSHGLIAWQASRGWTADAFDVALRDNAKADEMFIRVVELADSHGYHEVGNGELISGWTGPRMRRRFVRERRR
jgi:hypothetical protein